MGKDWKNRPPKSLDDILMAMRCFYMWLFYANLAVLLIEGCFTSTSLARVDFTEEWVFVDAALVLLLAAMAGCSVVNYIY